MGQELGRYARQVHEAGHQGRELLRGVCAHRLSASAFGDQRVCGGGSRCAGSSPLKRSADGVAVIAPRRDDGCGPEVVRADLANPIVMGSREPDFRAHRDGARQAGPLGQATGATTCRARRRRGRRGASAERCAERELNECVGSGRVQRRSILPPRRNRLHRVRLRKEKEADRRRQSSRGRSCGSRTTSGPSPRRELHAVDSRTRALRVRRAASAGRDTLPRRRRLPSRPPPPLPRCSDGELGSHRGWSGSGAGPTGGALFARNVPRPPIVPLHPNPALRRAR